jgi:hypothetical protein
MFQYPNGATGFDLPAYSGGIRTAFGIYLPPGGKVHYVRSGGVQSNDDAFLTQGSLCTTLNEALARCRSGLGDTVVCLPGHSESVSSSTALSSLVAGTNIVGVGFGSMMPVFRWTAATAQWALSKADVRISGLRLRLEGANNITKAINVTGADNIISDCEIEMSSGASNDAAIGIEVGTGSTRFRFLRNYVRGTTAVTDGIKIVAASDGIELGNNRMFFAATEINGLVHITAAATNLWFHHNTFSNLVASSTACIVVDDVAATGVFEYHTYFTLNDGTATAQGAIFGSGALIGNVQCFSVDQPKKSGILTPTAGT